MPDVSRDALTVSQLNDYIKLLIDRDEILSEISVRGEISNFKNHYATGHFYFSLKDDKSVIRCVMFASYAQKMRFVPENGMKVVLFGRVSVFPRDGAYQIYVSAMIPDGLGEQYLTFEQLKKKLAAEGLFDPARKKPLPKYPTVIGLVTSATGAAVRDLCSILDRRFPLADVLIYPALVQGTDAPASVSRGIRYFNEKNNVDLIIIGRGGGSGEDLSAFNDEGLARTVAASRIPLISAVGHEVDFTISDFVADLRAPTPSAAAELAVPDAQVLRRQLGNVLLHCGDILHKKISYYEERLRALSASGVLSSPERSLELREQELAWLETRLHSGFSAIAARAEHSLASACGRLEAMNPLAVLERGYAAVSTEREGTEAVVTDALTLSPGDEVRVRLRDGIFGASVTEVSPLKSERSTK